MQEKLTIHDIARILNVSSSTVSRALNNNPRISPGMREEIHKLAADLGYRRNNVALSLRSGKSMTAGVIVPRITRNFFSSVIGGLEEVLSKSSYNLMICQTLEDHAKELDILKTLVNMQVDVIFISLSAGTVKTDHLKELIKKGKRIIMFDRVDEKLDTEMVKLNDYQGAYNTIVHMLQQGYLRIVHFAGPDNLTVYRERKNGYIDALRDHGINYNKVIKNTITRETGEEAFNQLFRQNIRPDGIFAASDYSALGALLAARKKRISVPSDMGIAGFANEPFTEYVFPGITTTDQKARLMGQKIASMFLNDPEGKEHKKIIIDPELIIRKSTLSIKYLKDLL
ncbi:MAG: LacI family DNA-binding transcriptional regulator [Bacteroidales bacterium]|nr:LacI family DNA-binding transcriptional regulator [Bacteroidales bacterium]